MKTDSLFCELFKAHPASLFELAGLEADGEYFFESITVKTTEKRLDGFFRRSDGNGFNGFLEVQSNRTSGKCYSEPIFKNDSEGDTENDTAHAA